MTDTLIRHDIGGGITRITLNKAPVNALSAAFLMDFAALLEDLAQDDSVKAVLIDSAFKVFSAGLNLKEAQGFDLKDQHAILTGLNVAFLRLFSFPKPTIVAVNGAAIAGGLFFVLAADYRIGTDRAQLGLAEVRVGADFPVGPLEVARATLDTNTLRRLMLGGRPMTAQASLTAGMLDEIVSPDALDDTARKAAQHYAGLPPKTYSAVKRQIRQAVIDQIETAMSNGANTPADGWFNDETVAAMKAMIG